MGYEETALLTLYRRHSERCPVHKLKVTPAAKRKYMDCDYPLWIYGNTETTHVPRQSTGTNVIAVAEAQRQALLKNGQDQRSMGRASMIASSASAHRAKRNSAKKPPRPIVSSSIGCVPTAQRVAFTLCAN
jgi:hypothetical protein